MKSSVQRGGCILLTYFMTDGAAVNMALSSSTHCHVQVKTISCKICTKQIYNAFQFKLFFTWLGKLHKQESLLLRCISANTSICTNPTVAMIE